MTESSMKHHGDTMPETSSSDTCSNPKISGNIQPHPNIVHGHHRSSKNLPTSATIKQDQQATAQSGQAKLVYYQGKNDTIWNVNFQKLVLYQEEHQDCLVPQNYDRDPALGRWVHQQRVKLRQSNLSHSRTEKLNGIGFTWSQAKEAWLIMYDRLVDYKAANGNCMVIRAYKPDLKLGKWVNNQRHRRHKISKERQDMLTNLGFNWATVAKKSGSSQNRTPVRSSRTTKHGAAPKTHMVSTTTVNQAPVPLVSYLEHYQNTQDMPNNNNNINTDAPPQDYESTIQASPFMNMVESTTTVASPIMVIPPGMCKKYERVTAASKTSTLRSYCRYHPDIPGHQNKSHPQPSGGDGTKLVPQVYSNTPLITFSPLPASKRATPSDLGSLVSRGIEQHLFGDSPPATKRIKTVGAFQPMENQGSISGGCSTTASFSCPPNNPKTTKDHAPTSSAISNQKAS